jgi:hypothetical protein
MSLRVPGGDTTGLFDLGVWLPDDLLAGERLRRHGVSQLETAEDKRPIIRPELNQDPPERSCGASDFVQPFFPVFFSGKRFVHHLHAALSSMRGGRASGRLALCVLLDCAVSPCLFLALAMAYAGPSPTGLLHLPA